MEAKIKLKNKKTFKDPACVHMSEDKSKVVIFVSGVRGNYRCNFTIGNQNFSVSERETKAEAEWWCMVLETAFTNLKTSSDSSFEIINKNKKKWKQK